MGSVGYRALTRLGQLFQLVAYISGAIPLAIDLVLALCMHHRSAMSVFRTVIMHLCWKSTLVAIARIVRTLVACITQPIRTLESVLADHAFRNPSKFFQLSLIDDAMGVTTSITQNASATEVEIITKLPKQTQRLKRHFMIRTQEIKVADCSFVAVVAADPFESLFRAHFESCCC